MLRWTLERVSLAARVDRVALATSTRAENDPLSAIAHDLDVDVYRGSEDDVLRRFAEAAREFRAETIVRVCADSPLVAPEFIDAAIDCYEVERPDLAYNLGPRYGCEFPFGMGCEVFGKEILNNMDAKVTEPQHREHVTAYLHNHRDEYRISIVPYRPYWVRCNTNIHLTVDLPEDLDYIRRLASCMQFDTPVNAIVERIRTIK